MSSFAPDPVITLWMNPSLILSIRRRILTIIAPMKCIVSSHIQAANMHDSAILSIIHKRSFLTICESALLVIIGI